MQNDRRSIDIFIIRNELPECSSNSSTSDETSGEVDRGARYLEDV